MELEGLKFVGVGLTTMGMLGAALAIAIIFAALLDGIARNPAEEQKMMKGAFVGAGLAEAMGLFSFLVAILLLFF